MTEDNGSGFEDIETLDGVEVELDPLFVEELSDDPDGPRIWSMSAEQMREAEEFGRKFLLAIARLKGVRINRDDFLSAELHKRGFSDARVQAAIFAALNTSSASLSAKIRRSPGLAQGANSRPSSMAVTS